MSLVTTSCNQCDQNSHTRCPAENLARWGFISKAGDHCYCASQNHPTPESTKEIPRVKSMFSKIKDVDPHVEEPEVVEE